MKNILFQPYWHKYQECLKKPKECQRKQFQELIEQGKKTRYGEENHFQKVFTYSDFKDLVLINNHEDLWPFIEQELKTGKSMLWSQNSSYFAQSSGTTSAKKIIPVSKDALRYNHVLAGRMLYANLLRLSPEFSPFTGKSFALTGSRQVNFKYPNAYIADVSALVLNNLPFWARMFVAPKVSLCISDMHWDNKLAQISKKLINENVISLSGVPSWVTRLLEVVLKMSQKEKIIDLWPNLKLFCHGGVNLAPYRERLIKLIGKEIIFLNCYNASEGFFAFQDRLNSDDMLLVVNAGIFYEFLDLKTNEIFPLEDVVVNKTYALVITTNAGLWRYQIGDTIQFTQTHPYRIQIVGRTKQFINLVGEELMITHSDSAVSYTVAILGITIDEYTVAPFCVDGENYHHWFIESNKVGLEDKISRLIDLQLKECNADYLAKRDNRLLNPPKITLLAPYTFQSILARLNKLGGQHKVVRLNNSFDNEIIKRLINEHS